MCGISGAYQRGEDSSRLREAVLRMNRSQALRGPDDEGIFGARGIALGHRRLSILDLTSAGHQPMADGDGRYHITFNGEIYNFRELRGDLEKSGHTFPTQTDTEVILAAYKEWGVDSFVKFRGMFAFGLWDDETRELYLVRDHYGIKPLYYYAKPGMAVFASTVKAIEESGLVPLEKNPDATIGFFLFGSVPQPLTTLKDVFALPAGHYLCIDTHGEKLLKYYDPIDAFLEKRNISFEDAVAETKRLLKDSVAHHLISDASLGVFLSGGLDSSALAALAAKGREESLTTLAITFNEAEFSEKRYQQMVAERIASDHREILVTKKDFSDQLSAIFGAMDQPTIDGGNTYCVSWAAKRTGLKVVLSGLGSDEIFMGYGTFRRARLLRFLQKCPGIVPRALSLLGGRYEKLSHLTYKDPLHFYLAYRGLRTAKEVAEILGISEQEVHECVGRIARAQDFPKELSKLDPRDSVSYLELKEYLQNQLLKDTDFMSMTHSIEVRVPFLDRPLVEYVSSLPTRVKMYGKYNKPLLVAAMRDILPREIFERKKMGFTFPFERWLRNAPSDVVANDAAPASGIKGFRTSKMHWSKSWSLIVARKFNLL